MTRRREARRFHLDGVTRKAKRNTHRVPFSSCVLPLPGIPRSGVVLRTARSESKEEYPRQEGKRGYSIAKGGRLFLAKKDKEAQTGPIGFPLKGELAQEGVKLLLALPARNIQAL